jgi:hypothetical protein
MKTKTKEKQKYESFWSCNEVGCEQAISMSIDEFKAHLKEKHGKEVTKDTKCTKRMQMHMDGDTWYSSIYDVDILGLKATNSTCNKRTGEDAMYWAGA